MYLEKISVAVEVQYLDNITKKIIFAPVVGRGENFEFWILNFELGGTSGSASRTGRDVGQVREVYAKEIAKCVYEQLNKPMDVEEMLKKLAEKMNNNQFTE